MDIFEAAENGDTDAVRKYIESGIKVNAKSTPGVPVIISAAVNGRSDTVKALIEAKADINARNKYWHDGFDVGGWQRTSGNDENIA